MTKRGAKYCLECDLCPTQVDTSILEVQKHVNMHKGLKPFSCALCERRLATVYSFKMHTKTHPSITPDQLSKCQALINWQTQQEKVREEELTKMLCEGVRSIKELCRRYEFEQEDVHAVPGDVTEADKSVDKDISEETEKDEDCDDETAAVAADDDDNGNDEEIDEEWDGEQKVNT